MTRSPSTHEPEHPSPAAAAAGENRDDLPRIAVLRRIGAAPRPHRGAAKKAANAEPLFRLWLGSSS